MIAALSHFIARIDPRHLHESDQTESSEKFARCPPKKERILLLDRLEEELGRFDLELALLGIQSASENGTVADAFRRILSRHRADKERQARPKGRLQPDVLHHFFQMARDGACSDTAQKKVSQYCGEFSFLILHRDFDALLQCQRAAEEFLAGMGLELNREKSRIAHTIDRDRGCPAGFDFLSFHIRSKRVGKHQKASRRHDFITLVRPSKAAFARHQQNLRFIVKRNGSAGQQKLVMDLNRCIRGWCGYFKVANCAEDFSKMDHLLWRKLFRWGKRRHSSKSPGWVVGKYWTNGEFTESPGMPRLIWHREHRPAPHVKVRSSRSPYDRLDDYWRLAGNRLKRRQAQHPLAKDREDSLLDLHSALRDHGSDLPHEEETDDPDLPSSLRA